jgi:hypothetical protein
VLRLGLPLERVGPAWGCVALALLAYGLTLAPDLTFYDSPELALAAHQLGLGHPIGQPLHTWLGFLAAHLPGVPPLIGLTALSALFGALALVPAWALAERLAGPRADPRLLAPGLVAAALHPIAWEPSTRVEVYSLAAFLVLWAAARAFGERTRLWPIGLALGLAATTNAVIAVAFGLALSPRLVELARGAWRRELGTFVAAGLAGLVPYVQLPLVAGDPTRFVWGAPTDAASLAAYLSGSDYVHNAGIDGATFVDHVWALAEQGLTEGSLPLAALGLVGFATLGRKSRGGRWLLAVAGALALAFVARNRIFHPDVPDYRGYFFAPWLASAASVSALAAWLAARGARFRVYGVLVAALPTVAVALTPSHLIDRRDHPALGRAMVTGTLAEAPRDAILLVAADHWVGTLLYAQEVEGQRADVVIVPHGLASSSWYWDHLFARHPSLGRMPLRGPGGRDGRIRRLLAANPSRPVLAEHVQLALAAGRVPCDVSWLVWTGPQCDAPPSREASHAIAAAWTEQGEAREVAARVGMARGEALWRLGRGADAYVALVAGQRSLPDVTIPEQVPPLRAALPAWTRDAALHDPARNLFVAGWLLESVGRRTESGALLARAAAEGLPEATALLGSR